MEMLINIFQHFSKMFQHFSKKEISTFFLFISSGERTLSGARPWWAQRPELSRHGERSGRSSARTTMAGAAVEPGALMRGRRCQVGVEDGGES
jgi:hypothetical protein